MSSVMRIVAEGLRFPEGPVYVGNGEVVVAEMKGEAICRVSGSTLTRLGDCGGAPNGVAPGANGEFYVANNGGLSAEGAGYWHAPRQFDGRVQRVAPSGEVTTVFDAFPGPAPHRPNDLCFGPDGTLYVTDSGNWEDMRNIRAGSLVALGAQRWSVEIPAMPNGVAVAPDGRVFVTQTLTKKVLVVSDGETTPFAKLPGGMPDGLCFDADGNLYVCASFGNAVYVYSPDGSLAETLDTGPGTQPTNCCLGDGVLYVTLALTGQLAAFDLGVKAAAVHSGAIA
ncbi:SMP-30/gluconolactonase/LRE family protein [Cryptosporangium sp. NPDC048952]|uniref:SMP-30/gluconolactonase/LRE family protein n=1 Tax=Cryptosporangium sp. NPDC048952 TaxID=3363961 RepID=UPI003716C9BC